MKVLVVEPGKKPVVKEIGTGLSALQETVGGLIEVVYPWENDTAVLVCNDEGKLLGQPLNRALRDEESGEVFDVIAGTFFICDAPPDSESFASLTDEQVLKYRKRFEVPECFINLGGKVVVLPDLES